MNCPNCGNYVSGIVAVCPVCGRKLSSTNQADGRIEQQWKNNPKFTQPAVSEGPDQRKIIAVISVIVVLIVAGGFAAIFHSLKQTEVNPSETVQAPADPAEGGQNAKAEQEPAQEQEKEPGQSPEQIQSGEQQPSQNQEQSSQNQEQQPSQNQEQAQQSEAPEENAESAPAERGAAAERNSELYYFRALLEGEELSLYDALYDISRVDTVETEKELYLSVNPESDDFSEMLSKARSFLTADHPELFYIRTFSYMYNTEPDQNGKYRVTLRCGDFVPADHAQELEEMERAADELLSRIDTSQSLARIALQIHDKILDLVQYDYETYESQKNFDYAYSAYGALVANSSGEPNKAVCAGYAAAYEYLLQKEGIVALVVGGNAWSQSEPAGPHSWNLVKLDGDWYETDCTWDDNVHDGYGEEEDPRLQEAINDEDFRNTTDHYLFQVTTEKIENFDPEDDYTYTFDDGGWATFLGKSGRSRSTLDDVQETGDYATPYAPIAEGTKYSYENIR